MDKTQRILVLPGTCWQVPLVDKIRQMGYRVIVVNPAPDSPAFALADEKIISDIFAKENYLEKVRKEGVAAVISDECDIATRLIAELADSLGVPSQTKEMAELFSNKYQMRLFLKKHGFPCPEFKLCHTLDECIQFYRGLQSKMIMKPLDSNSSHGVFTITREEDIQSHFAESISFSRGVKAVLCERFIEGTEFTVDGIKTDAGHTSLAISQKKHYAYNENIANELFFSYDNPVFDYSRLREVNDIFVNISGLPFGLTHAEYKYEAGQFYLIEIGARGGGNLISSHIVPCLSGYDNYAALINMALGHSVGSLPFIREDYKQRCAVLSFFDAPGTGGIVKGIHGESLLKNNTSILSYNFNFNVGDKIEKAANDSARVGYYIAWAESREALQQLMREIDENVYIQV